MQLTVFYARLGYVKVPRIEEAFDSRNLLPSTALDPEILREIARTFLGQIMLNKIEFA